MNEKQGSRERIKPRLTGDDVEEVKKKCLKIFLVGKMEKDRDFDGAQLFDEATDKINQSMGFLFERILIINPTFDSINLRFGWNFEDCLKKDFDAIASCDAVFMLKNWTYSKGAKRKLLFAAAYEKSIFFDQLPCERTRDLLSLFGIVCI